jgi:hypothetical protein
MKAPQIVEAKHLRKTTSDSQLGTQISCGQAFVEYIAKAITAPKLAKV